MKQLLEAECVPSPFDLYCSGQLTRLTISQSLTVSKPLAWDRCFANPLKAVKH